MKLHFRACRSVSSSCRHYLVASTSVSALHSRRVSSGSGGRSDTENDRRLSWPKAKSYVTIPQSWPHFKEGM